MANKEKWKSALSTYTREQEPGTIEKTYAWETAIGLQAVDGLEPSDYLVDVAKKNIEGDVDIAGVKTLITNYYKAKNNRAEVEERSKEADSVSARITELINEKAFQFSPVEYKNIHRRLFEEVLERPGEYRDYNISKAEWVLDNESVVYAPFDTIKETIEYDFNQEKEFSYKGISMDETIKHIAKFTSNIWQVHCFCEGNTRTTAVFIIKYLKTMGFTINNDMFRDNSWYFRDALVRANYENYSKGIYANMEYLQYFFENLLLNKNHQLKNRFLHIVNDEKGQKNRENSMEYTLEEKTILNAIGQNPKITQKELAKLIGKSERTIKRIMDRMKNSNTIVREDSKKTGYWKIK